MSNADRLETIRQAANKVQGGYLGNSRKGRKVAAMEYHEYRGSDDMQASMDHDDVYDLFAREIGAAAADLFENR